MSPAPHDDSATVTLGIMRDIVTEVARRGVKVTLHLQYLQHLQCTLSRCLTTWRAAS